MKFAKMGLWDNAMKSEKLLYDNVIKTGKPFCKA